MVACSEDYSVGSAHHKFDPRDFRNYLGLFPETTRRIERPPAAVTATYGIAGMYMIGDIAYAGYAESQKPGTTSSHIGKTVAHSTVPRVTATSSPADVVT